VVGNQLAADGVSGRRAAVWTGTGFAAAVLAGVVLSLALSTSRPILASKWSNLLLLAAWAGAWVVAVLLAFRLPRRFATVAILASAAALRLAALAGPPVLSDDLYRYSWDGRVQAAGIDPYRHPPDDPALSRLRERWLWPDRAGCERLHRPEGCTRINRPEARTIYPPLAQLWFSGVYRTAGIAGHHKVWQVTGLLSDMALVGLLPVALRAWKRDTRWSALYALAPFPVIEVVNNGHVDGLAALLVVAALVLAARRRPGWAGALLGAATLVKLYPLVAVLALVAVNRRPTNDNGRDWGSLGWGAAGSVGVIAAGYLPHVLAVGPRVLGYLPDYLREEHYDQGGRFLLAGLGVGGDPAGIIAAGGLLLVGAWVLWRRPGVPASAAALLGGLLLAATPVQPWYAVPLLAVAAVAARPVWAAVAAAGYPYFFAVILDSPHAVVIGRVSYGVALAAVIVAARRRPVTGVSTAGAAGLASGHGTDGVEQLEGYREDQG